MKNQFNKKAVKKIYVAFNIILGILLHIILRINFIISDSKLSPILLSLVFTYIPFANNKVRKVLSVIMAAFGALYYVNFFIAIFQNSEFTMSINYHLTTALYITAMLIVTHLKCFRKIFENKET